MSLLEKIKNDQLELRKAGNAKANVSTLTTLFSEAAIIGFNDGKRESTDEEVIAVIKKFLKGIEDCMKVVSDTSAYQEEKRLLLTYLPKQMTDDELQSAIEGYIADVNATSIKQMGLVMKRLKDGHEGLYDGLVASSFIKARLG